MASYSRSGEWIEIAGPAGCGKTTLVEALTTRIPTRPGVTKCGRACIPVALRLLPLLPAGFLWRELSHGRFPRDTLRSMVYLESWLLDRSRSEPGDTLPTLYDHGPFFRLATLQTFGPQGGEGLRRWWKSMRQAWSETMTLVVWLDAPDDLLLERIRARDRNHACKHMGDDEARAWLARYRAGFESALAVIEKHRPAEVVRYDTSVQRANEIADSLLELLESRRE
jgi:MoxR-like ATPase